jgi:hypothetical protein
MREHAQHTHSASANSSILCTYTHAHIGLVGYAGEEAG